MSQDNYICVEWDGATRSLAPGNDKFWRRVAGNDWEPYTFGWLARVLDADSVYLDIGAWIGPTVLYAARRSRWVYCLEPDPVAYERLLTNLRLNQVANVSPLHAAWSEHDGRVTLTNADEFGNSETRVAECGAGQGVEVLALSLARYVNWWGIEKIDALKIDIEGAEFDLLPCLENFLNEFCAAQKPHLHLSLHAPLFPESQRMQKLAAVVGFAKNYQFCLDKHLNPIALEDIATPRFAEKFDTLVLSDVAI